MFLLCLFNQITARNRPNQRSLAATNSLNEDFKYLHPSIRQIFQQKEIQKFDDLQNNHLDIKSRDQRKSNIIIENTNLSNRKHHIDKHSQTGGVPYLTSKTLNSNITEEWRRYYSPNDDSADNYATAIAYDKRGFIYVTGYSESANGYDFLTIKYDTLGNEQWTARYNGPGDGDDYPVEIVLDSIGNIYVTGSSMSKDTYFDYVTIKYDNFGGEQWVTRYNGSGDSSDYAYAIAVDDSGNVYVTGASWTPSSNYDYITIKYNKDGVEKWEKQYNGTGNLDDEPSAIAVDKLGNVWVTGKSWGTDTYYDYATVLYQNDGVATVFRYNGIGNGNDEATALTLDDSGNVIVTGSSAGLTSGNDYATIKYSNLNMSWVAIYDSTNDDKAMAIVVDDSGNVYVTGINDNNTITTIKYNLNGIEQWKRNKMTSGDSHSLVVTGMTIDSSSNIYLTSGSSDYIISYFLTIKYDKNGDEQWYQYFELEGDGINTGLVADANENIYVTGYSEYEYYDDCKYGWHDGFHKKYQTIKYNKMGVQEWVKNYNGPSMTKSYPIDLKVDKFGNIFIAGISMDPIYRGFTASWYYWHILKFNKDGIIEWNKRINNKDFGSNWPIHYWSGPITISINEDGNLYIGGRSETIIGTCISTNAYQTIKYNVGGIEEWRKTQSEGWGDNILTAMAVDKNGNSYLTGSYYDWQLDKGGYFTIKNNNNGIESWRATFKGDETYPISVANSIKLDKQGNVYVTGKLSKNNKYDYGTIKYNNDGIEQWNIRFNGTADGYDEAKSIAIDDSCNVYITGMTYNTTTGFDFTTIKYDSSGNEKWVRNYNGTANGNDTAVQIEIDNYGNIYVAGTSDGLGSGNDYLLIKYDKSGAEKWVARFNSYGNNNDQLVKMVLDRVGNVYLTGRSIGISGTIDYLTIKIDTSGNEKWVVYGNGEDNRDDYVAGIDLDSLGNIYITGSTQGEGNTSNFLIIKYHQTNNISGIVFDDENGNGVKDNDEHGIMGWRIYLSGTETLSATTDSNGIYKFTNIGLGTYTVSEENPIGWIQTKPSSPNVYQVTIGINGMEVSGNDFGNFKLGTISGFVYEDKNRNHIKDTDEVGLENWFVKLKGIVNDTILTDQNGYYSFNHLPIGTYSISEDVKADWIQTYPTNKNDYSISINKSGEESNDVNFGNLISVSKVKIGLTYYNADGSGYRTIYFGIRSGAANGIWGIDPQATYVDSLEGESELPPPITGTFDIRFVNPDKSPNYFGYGTWVDVRNFTNVSQCDTFKISFQPGVSGYPVMFKWSKELIKQAFVGDVTIGKKTGNRVNMKLEDSLVISNAITNTIYIISENPNIPILYNKGWNMVSLPIIVEDNRKEILFPNSISNLFTYNNIMGYITSNVLELGKGYWIKLSGMTPPIVLNGTEIYSDTITVFNGWNMIGSLNMPIPIHNIETIPQGIISGNFFGYNNAYYVADTLKPFIGYWVKVKQDGLLIMHYNGE